MKRLVILLPGLLLCLASWAATAQELNVGLIPNLSTRQLLEIYQPLRTYLEQQLRRPVTLYTSPDFNSFVNRTQNGEYDLVITAPHFARLAQTDAGYQPLFAYRNEITAVVVVAKNSNISQLAQLRGGKIVAPGPIAIVSMLGLALLRENGLEEKRDYEFQWATSHSNTAQAVLHGDARAGVIGNLPLKQLPQDISSQLRVLAHSSVIPPLILLAHKRITPPEVQQIKKALLQFEHSESGQKFFASNGLVGLRPVQADDLKSLEPYAREAKRLLELPK